MRGYARALTGCYASLTSMVTWGFDVLWSYAHPQPSNRDDCQTIPLNSSHVQVNTG